VSNRKLLLADDSVTIQKVINLTFADEGIQVMAVGDGDTAMERFYDFRPDIVLADVNMPGMNGYRICENLRQHEDTANIPVILLVGSFESFDENEARRVGANDWLTKPFQSIRQLVTKVSELLEAPASNGGQDSNAVIEPEVLVADHEDHPPTKENEDIDDLYRQSFVETIELPGAFKQEHMLGDAGMDDEMIETVHAGAVNAVPEIREFSFSPVEDISEFADTVPGAAHTTFEMPASETANFDETLPVIDFRPAEVPDRAEIPVDDYDSLGSASFDAEVHRENEFVFQPEPEIVADEPLALRDAPPEFDEMNLLEIPSTQTGTQDAVRSDENIAMLGGATRSDDLSPEFIEAVARKVIERISDNVIRQIAWQVVPQVAESVLREKAEKESNQ
jgi:CheY-like chemotaxis protein